MNSLSRGGVFGGSCFLKIINVESFPNFEQIARSTKEHFKAERPRRPGAGCALMLDDVIYLRFEN